MSKRSHRDLGEMDAHKDQIFKEHFIELQNLDKIIDDDSDIIFGLKGSGKTALCRALSELHQDKYFNTKIIDLDNISFTQTHEALKKLNNTTNKEIVNLASLTWRNVLLIYGVEAVSDILDESHYIKAKIDKFILNGQYSNPKSNNRLIASIQNLLIKIKNIGLENPEEAPIGLSIKQLDEVDRVIDEEFIELLNEIKNVLLKNNKKVLLCLDGFDSIIDHTNESRNAIFTGLIDAIYKLSKDTLLSQCFCFKAFLPRELTDGVQFSHFDADKFIFNSHFLNWSVNEFEKFLSKRMIRFARTKSPSFKDIWSEIMPEKIYNPVHNSDENTFSYILRHTLYRPRHLLIQLQSVLDEWDSKYLTTKVDPSFIPKVVSSTNSKLSHLIAGELEYTIPGITMFLHSWNGISNTTKMQFFRDRLKRLFQLESYIEISDLFDKLYNFGVIGYAREADLIKTTSNSVGFNYSYVDGAFGSRKIYNSLEDNDVIALSPIFKEYCGTKVSEYGIIYPKRN